MAPLDAQQPSYIGRLAWPRTWLATSATFAAAERAASLLWHQCLGHPGITQLAHLRLPAHKQLRIHPLHSCQVCHDTCLQKQPAGPVQSATDLRPGSRFHLDLVSCVPHARHIIAKKARSIARRLQCVLPYHRCIQATKGPRRQCCP
jgi:hypothetical protein